jgi:hypothetical protein
VVLGSSIFLLFHINSPKSFVPFRELLFLHKNNTMVVLLETTSVQVSFIQIMQIRVQNKGKRAWKSRYVGDVSAATPPSTAVAATPPSAIVAATPPSATMDATPPSAAVVITHSATAARRREMKAAEGKALGISVSELACYINFLGDEEER